MMTWICTMLAGLAFWPAVVFVVGGALLAGWSIDWQMQRSYWRRPRR